jgi:hypothetical protein
MGGGHKNFVYPQPQFAYYECGFTTAIPPGVSTQSHIVRAGLTHDFQYHPSNYYVTTAFCQMLQECGPVGSPRADAACIAALSGLRQFDGVPFKCADGQNDNGFVADFSVYMWQGQQRGRGLNNQFWASDLGGDGGVHDKGNQSVNGQAYADWIMACRRLGLRGPLPKADSLHDANAWLRWPKRAEMLGLTAEMSGGVERSKGAKATTPAELAVSIPASGDNARPYEPPNFWAAFVLAGDPD